MHNPVTVLDDLSAPLEFKLFTECFQDKHELCEGKSNMYQCTCWCHDTDERTWEDLPDIKVDELRI